MKKSLMLLILTSLLLFQFAVAAENQQPAQAPYTDQTKPILINKNHPNFSIKLKSTPGTGYTWILKSANGDYIDAVFQKTIPSHNKMMGAAGTTEFGFVAKPIAFKVTRQFKITFVYARPWEISDRHHQETIFIVITEGGS